MNPLTLSARSRARASRALRWWVPGMRVKRYAFVATLGVLAILLGIVQLSWDGPLVSGLFSLTQRAVIPGLPTWLSGLVWMGLGGVVGVMGIRRMNRSMVEVFIDPQGLSEQIYVRRKLEAGPRIAALGGGTGLSLVLRGLRQHTTHTTAVVAVTDDGGSTGRLRHSFGIPAVGDLVDCLAALSDAEGMPELMEYRFSRGGELAGHTFGNLMLVTLNELNRNFALALRQANAVLRLRGAVWPATPEPVLLWVEREDGSRLTGESVQRQHRGRIVRVGLTQGQGVEPVVSAMPEALQALRQAELIVLGPGSLYTSVIPSFLPPEISEAIRQSPARLVYIANVMTEPGETDGMNAFDHYQAIVDHLGRMPQAVLVHTQPLPPDLLARYHAEGQEPVLPELQQFAAREVRVVGGDFLRDFQPDDPDPQARHDPAKLVRALLKL